MQHSNAPESDLAGRAVGIKFVLPINSENRWSDMLAVLVSTDAGPICQLLGLHVDPKQIVIHRELSLNVESRPDVLLKMASTTLAVLEAKVLAGIGPGQLSRYYESEPDAAVHALISPKTLIADTTGNPPWRTITWEDILEAYLTSENEWVKVTARSWLDHIADKLPQIGPNTVWNALNEGEEFLIAIRSRMSWLFSNLTDDTKGMANLDSSSAGASPILILWAETKIPGYWIEVEIEEQLQSRHYPAIHWATNYHKALGPTAKVTLLQKDVTSSKGFDWEYLQALWPTMEAARNDWVQNTPNRKAEHEKVALAQMRAAGVPKWVGIGFGEAHARKYGKCMFGARIQFDAGISLGQLAQEVELLMDLANQLAAVPYEGLN